MKCLLFAATMLSTVVLTIPAVAAPDSAYSTLDTQTDCTVIDQAVPDDGGDWSELRCSGYADYPIYLSYGDARESLFYGFPPDGKPDSWESFGGFNGTGPTVEWRMEDGVPFATIHRWHVSGADPSKTIQVLVIEKVAQPDGQSGCVVGYVVATGNPQHNEQARELADAYARDFSCWVDDPIVREGAISLPQPQRHRNEN